MAELTPMQIAERSTWQYRAVTKLRGNQTELGALLLAILKKNAANPPKFSMSATITKDNLIVVGLLKPGAREPEMKVWEIPVLTAMFSRLADQLKLNDADRIDMFAHVRNWIVRDERAIKQSLQFFKTQ